MRIVSLCFLTSFFVFVGTDVFAASLTCNDNQSAENCMVCNCYHETRGEPLDGMIAVNKVVLSRAEDDSFPNSPCGVVFDDAQFSWTEDRAANNIRAKREEDREALDRCRKAVKISVREGPNEVLYYYNPNVASPGWARRMKKCGSIGNHAFLVPRGEKCPRKLGAESKYRDYTPEKKASSGKGIN
ncbi:cell wall hydrolase [Bdellovibrio sp. HCB290]|uniref:cell wall hydrolase n=1 Tax=Bdellovibrio sp. HCB290 TaxID=3394356 RepID=UPI0039B3815B